MATMKIPQKKSKGEEEMAIILKHIGLEFIRQYRFHNERKWLVDFWVPKYNLIIEVDGAVYIDGRHTRGKGYTDDRIRDNSATLMGFTVLRFTTWMVGAYAETMLRTLIRREEHAKAGKTHEEEADPATA